MDEECLITIVIPVYKVEKFLCRCIDSILNQTYSKLEIILVDDGSPDKSGEICDRYANRDERIKVIHKKNGGLSDARNAGTKIATGKYITYIDSDDYVSNDYIETLYSTLKKYDADICVCDLIMTDVENISLHKEKSIEIEFDYISAIERMLYQTLFDTNACGKLYPTYIMKNILYPKGKLYEDLFTTYRVFGAVKKVVYINQKKYYYWQNPDSIMHNVFNKRMFDEIEAVDEIVKYVEKNMPEIKKAAYARKFSSYSQVIRWMPDDADEDSLDKRNQLWKFVKQYRCQMIFDSKARKKNRLAGVIAYMGMGLYRKISNRYN